jgi:hypothetical protein
VRRQLGERPGECTPDCSRRLNCGSASPEQSAPTGSTALPTGLVSRADILSRFGSDKQGVSTQAKLVRLADLAMASDDTLTQCQYRGCPPGALVWLVLLSGPPRSFGQLCSTGELP